MLLVALCVPVSGVFVLGVFEPALPVTSVFVVAVVAGAAVVADVVVAVVVTVVATVVADVAVADSERLTASGPAKAGAIHTAPSAQLSSENRKFGAARVMVSLRPWAKENARQVTRES